MSLLSPEELTLLYTDNKYKNYVSSIEKCLKNFESSSEWADLISSLGKLKKVIHGSPKYQYIPKRVNVCKRLSQCLHPALPSGVHLKALEVYTCIFQNIGPENLARDLFLYSSGLFPLLANAALSVKPVLLNLYESYFLPLKKSLRPGLSGLLIALLPGLEEGSDFYQRTFNLIKNICLVQSDNSNQIANINNYLADDKYFYSCLWSAIISESSIRFPAIQFILSNYELKKRNGSVSTDDQLYLIGNSIDLMINSICCCLQDPNSLVQRSILDLICICLPMSTNNVTRSDKIQLVTVAIHVILRRDMTLNRRIYSWLMGNDSKSDESKSKKNVKNYFELHSKSILIQSIKLLLNKKEASSILYLLNDEIPVPSSQAGTISHSMASTQTSPSTTTTLKLIKIISNLVERQDIGQAIIDDILLDLLFYVYKEYSYLNLNNGSMSSNVQSYLSVKKATSNFHHVQQQQQQSQNLKDSNELKKATCNFLFHSFQIFFIWEFCASKFESICKNYINSSCLESASSHTITSDNFHTSTLNPAQLCDLYEFILELLANSVNLFF